MAHLKLSRTEITLVITTITLVVSLCLGGMIWAGIHSLSDLNVDPAMALSQEISAVIPELGETGEIDTPQDQATGAPPDLPRLETSPPAQPEAVDSTPVLPGTARSTALTFATVFVAEMGDKTQLATMLMSAQSRSPWAIFLGSASALVTASLISVLLGEGLSQLLPPTTLQILAGSGFVVIGAYVLLMELWGPQDAQEEQ